MTNEGDNFPLKGSAILSMRLVLDALSLEMMIVGRESRSHGRVWSSQGKQHRDEHSHGEVCSIYLSTTSMPPGYYGEGLPDEGPICRCAI